VLDRDKYVMLARRFTCPDLEMSATAASIARRYPFMGAKMEAEEHSYM